MLVMPKAPQNEPYGQKREINALDATLFLFSCLAEYERTKTTGLGGSINY